MCAMPSIPNFESIGQEADPLLGRVINDRYKIIEPIGHGGMGRVYKALQAPLDRQVALKVLGAGHDRDPNFYKRFFLEASVTAKLTHPNTITLFDYGRTDDGIFFIAMEYLLGRTLSQTMQADGPLAQERVIHIAQQICRSLREAHALGIIHRDLKPANVILLRQQDDHDFVKVLDFGLVKFFQGDNPEGDITNAGTFMGSPHYIAPEQARNQSPDQRCDIYSLGVLMYHMVTGRVPFTAANPVDIILKHLHEAPVPPRQLRPELQIDANFEAIVLKAMAKDREQRYQSMDEFLASLKITRTLLTGLSGPPSMPPMATTEDGLRPVSLHALSASTPSSPMPSMRTPSQPMATPHHLRGMTVPPPPPPFDANDISGPRPRPTGAPQFASVTDKPGLLRPGVVIPSVIVAALTIGVLWLFTQKGAGEQAAPRTAEPAATAQRAPAGPNAIAAAAQEPATNAVPSRYETVDSGTTLVTVTSSPAGAEVRDTDDRFLGTTPFDLRVPSGKPVQLTLRRDGYKPFRINKSVSGERVSLSGSLKRETQAPNQAAAAPTREQPGQRKPTGYKDNPY